ncbi:MAG TPA: hypothetical protein VFL82_10430 [Thermomicrobiales bacterium]|nr:hypothetical protein [Thermomicrobiales bacterium]
MIGRGRVAQLTRAGLVLAIAMSVSGSVLTGSAHQMQPSGSAAIDPAALVLAPADTGEAGYFHDGAFLESLEGVAVNLATYRGGAPGDIQDALREAGWVRKYVSIMRQPTEASASTYRHVVMSYITEFQNATGAAKGFDITEDEEGVPSAHDLQTASTFGTRSEITMDQGTSGVSGQRYVSYDLTFQLDRFTAGVTLYQYDVSGTPAATPEATPIALSTRIVERLAGILAQRLSDATGQSQPGYSNVIQRLDGEDASYITYDDAYYRLGGIDIPLLGERPSATTARTASYGNATDVYQLWQGVDAATSDGLLYAAALFRFSSPADASTWLQQAPKALATNPAYPRLAEDTAPVAIGDESIALTYSPRGADSRVKASIIIARIGATVLRVQLAPVGNHQVTIRDRVEQLALTQATCLQNDRGACPAIPLPQAG